LAKDRKLGRTTKQRNSILRTLAAETIWHERIETTEARAKEVKSIVDSIIASAVKVKDDFEMADVKVSRAKLDSKGKKVTEKVTSKNGKDYYKVIREVVTEKKEKDLPSRLAARRRIMNKITKVKDADGNNIDLLDKLFNELGSKYATRVGGYTRIIKKGPRRGDGAEVVILELV
jgi:Ribosomal protein L17